MDKTRHHLAFPAPPGTSRPALELSSIGGYRLQIDSGAVSQTQIKLIDAALNSTVSYAVVDTRTNGTQATATGDCPPVAVGVPYTMEIGWLNGDCSDIGAGQEIFGGSATGGGVGCV